MWLTRVLFIYLVSDYSHVISNNSVLCYCHKNELNAAEYIFNESLTRYCYFNDGNKLVIVFTLLPIAVCTLLRYLLWPKVVSKNLSQK